MSLPPYLKYLETQSIEIFREVIANYSNPVLLYSIGKDSSVLLHLARKAYFPAPLPFPVLHVDTGWKFKEMIAFRDKIAKKFDINLIVEKNEKAEKEGMNPFDYEASSYTFAMKTVPLRSALLKGGYNAAIGGARRDEEKSRAKERIFSIRSEAQGWDPKKQRIEIGTMAHHSLNQSETVRVFPLSNWTELDIWSYIKEENIDVVDLYFAKQRPVIERDKTILMIDDDRFQKRAGEEISQRKIRFRTLGCYPLSGAIASNATNLDDIINELKEAKFSERQGRLIDFQGSSMEEKKREGYF